MPMDQDAPIPSGQRRFTLLDAMVLVAATALGCGVDASLNSLVASMRGQVRLDPVVLLDYLRDGNIPTSAILAMPLVMPLLAAWTLAMIPLRFIGPRPPDPGPGYFASWAFALAIAAITIFLGGVLFAGRVMVPEILDLSPVLPVFIAPAVMASWLTLALGGHWNPRANWLDRTGRSLGACWIILGCVTPALLMTADY